MARHATKHAFKLAAVVIPAASAWLDGVTTGPAIRWHRQARRQAGRLMVAVRSGTAADALRRYERDLYAWAERFA